MHDNTGLLGRTSIFAFSGALLLAACGGGGDVEAASSQNAGSPAGGSGRTDGTLTVGDRTFAFRITHCDLSDEVVERNDATVRGIGRLDDGTGFTVTVERGRVGSMLNHTISLNYGAYITGEGYFAEARRMQLATGWSDFSGNDDTPLIRIDGQTVQASGMFEVTDAGTESTVEGGLDVTCP